MVQHIVLWNFKEELDGQEREEALCTIRRKLEAVREQAAGVISLEVVGSGLASGNRDLGLISSFESAGALDAYQAHPAHVQAVAYIKEVTCDRVCLDYTV